MRLDGKKYSLLYVIFFHEIVLRLFFGSAANRGQLVGAIRDFRQALNVNRSHRNAHKYLTATLVEQGIQ